MAFEHWGYTFEGAWNNPNNFEAKPGVFVVWCKNGPNWSVLDVVESQDVKNSVLTHPRKDEWKKRCTAELYFATTYTPSLEQPARKELEQKIRGLSRPSCG